ncbi:hypothetical protein HMSSN036_49230 [Paenibacillus macerans]|nr:hypothetical protein HMSSN036_49230 [Paenibacillus macerans]
MEKSQKVKFACKAVSVSVLASALLLSACGNGGSKNSAANEQDPSGKITLNMMTQSSPLAPADPNDKLIFKRLEEKRTSISIGRISPRTCSWKKKSRHGQR